MVYKVVFYKYNGNIENKKDTFIIAKQIKKSIKDFDFQNAKQKDDKITVSTGIAIYPTDANDSNSLIEYADQMLYHAKNDRKNS